MIPSLEVLLSNWQQQLRAYSEDGTLGQSAMDALALDSMPAELARLLEEWSQGKFEGLPAIEILPGEALAGARGAYGEETRIIYLNADWLATASMQQILDVQNEELGHFLDATLKPKDTPGDEGEIFSRLLRGDTLDSTTLLQLRAEDDHHVITVDNKVMTVEFSAEPQSSSQTFQVNGSILEATASFDGIERYTVVLALSDTTYNTAQGKAEQLSAFNGTSATITLELAGDVAPTTVSNFLAYTTTGSYTNTLFHRIIDGFMIQGGGFDASTYEPKTTQAAISLESTLTTGLSNERGTVAMARTNDPNSATCQFFINSVDNLSLNYQSPSQPGYAAFGAVSDGMATVDAISKATQLNSLLSTPITGPFQNLTEPVVKITSAKLLELPTGLSFSIETPATHGDLQFDTATGYFLYTPNSDYIDDYFTYRASTPAWAGGIGVRTILRSVNLFVDNGQGTASAITSQSDAPFNEEVTLIAGGIEGDPDGPATITSYQWFLNGNAIAGATKATYLTSATGFGTYSVEETYIDDQGFTTTVSSNQQSVDKINNGQGTSAAIIAQGNAAFKEGVTLIAGAINSDPDGEATQLSYQWYRNGDAIEGATAETFTVPRLSISAERNYDNYSVDIAYIDAQGFRNGPIRSADVQVAPVQMCTSLKDRIIGRPNDSYGIASLSDSPISAFDTIVNYSVNTTIDTPNLANGMISLANSRGTLRVKSINGLHKAGRRINKLLKGTKFEANETAALRVKQGSQILGTALVFNDGQAGFNAKTDAVLFLENFIIGPSTPINLM